MLPGSPAHAGIDRALGRDCVYLLGFPRTRGDRPRVQESFQEQEEVPPHTRG